MQGLEKKGVVITGGASGIGAATAQRFLDEGSRVLVIDRDAEGCEALFESLPTLTGFVVADVSDYDEVASAFTEVDVMLQGIDVLVNNAGISIRHSFLDVTPEEWQRVQDVNLNGVFYVAQQAAKRMVAQGGGVILNMGSTNGIIGSPFYSDYNASKAGVIELTRTMALELAPTMRVNAVCPGYILTPMQEAEYTPAMIQVVNDKIPLARHGQPEEVAALFAFLASDDARYLTGQTFVIDGGEVAGGLASR
jgi:NAD(P)-dependent dehydrogenase (short-subunit alcohol dehydrogenase family)